MSNSFDNEVKIFCNICSCLTVSREDISSKIKFGVCRSCELKWVQPNIEKWSNGWRPTEGEIEVYREDIKKRIYSILSDINNYI